MKRGRISDDQIIGVPRERDSGTKIAALCHKLGVSEPTFHGWKAKFGATSVSDDSPSVGPNEC